MAPVWHGYGMPAANKSTYSLDTSTLATLNRLAQRWQVSKTEVVRRALREAAERETISPEERIAALHALQRSLAAKKVDFKKWQQTIKDGRR